MSDTKSDSIMIYGVNIVTMTVPELKTLKTSIFSVEYNAPLEEKMNMLVMIRHVLIQKCKHVSSDTNGANKFCPMCDEFIAE